MISMNGPVSARIFQYETTQGMEKVQGTSRSDMLVPFLILCVQVSHRGGGLVPI